MITPSFNQLVSDNPKQLWLQLFPADLEEAKQQSRDCSNEVARWNAYINYISLNALVKEFQEDLEEGIRVWPSRQALAEIWEVVNGSAIEVGDTRLVFIPSDRQDIARFSVPQEWVELPRWASHYYLAVQMHLEEDECWLRVWGFTTHQKLKQGERNASEGTYSVAREDLVESLNVLWVARDVCPEPQPAVAELQPLGKQRAEQLLAKLGKPTPYSPRLEADFIEWAPLIAQEQYRQELLVRRSQPQPEPEFVPEVVFTSSQSEPEPEPTAKTPALSQWFGKALDEAAEAIAAAGWLLADEVLGGKQANYGLRDMPDSPTDAKPNIATRRFRITEVGSERYLVIMALNLTEDSEKKTIWILPQVFPLGGENDNYLPAGLELIVLDDEGEAFERAEAGAGSKMLQLDDWFGDAPGTRFSVKLVLGQAEFVEQLDI